MEQERLAVEECCLARLIVSQHSRSHASCPALCFPPQTTLPCQAQLDALDSHTRFVNNSWHDWGDATDGPAAA